MEQGERPYEPSCKTEHRRVASGTDACQLVIQPQYGSLLQLTPRMEPDENGQTAGGTAFAVTGPHTVQLTLRGSAVVLLGLGGLALAAWLLFRKRKK